MFLSYMNIFGKKVMFLYFLLSISLQLLFYKPSVIHIDTHAQYKHTHMRSHTHTYTHTPLE